MPRESECQLAVDRVVGGGLLLRVSGAWRLRTRMPSATDVLRQIDAGERVRSVEFDSAGLAAWDSGLLTFLRALIEGCRERGIETRQDGLPEGVRRLLELAFAVPERFEAHAAPPPSLVARVGSETVAALRATRELVEFVGAASLSFGRFLRGAARYRRSDLFLTIQECGAQALPIVTLIGVLMGLILAFVGAVQLEQFGAQIYVADLVGLGITREMGAMMTGVLMAGRSGAAFAAQLGTMRVNEEIDALTTLGISAMDFLVLPRMLALAAMLPLLCLYADVLGLAGGAAVGVWMLDLSFLQYYNETIARVDLWDFGVGLLKSAAFGVLVAVAGCMRGMQCGKSSAAVGIAATSAVVTGIVFIVVADAVFTVMFNVIGV